MPRLSRCLLTRARAIHALLPMLLQSLRAVENAVAELKWLQQHAAKLASGDENQITTRTKQSRHSSTLQHVRRTGHLQTCRKQNRTASSILIRLCKLRARGTPLQYLLGTTYFGDLEVYASRGVLIPRQDTADMVEALAQRLMQHEGFQGALQNDVSSRRLSVLDLCTGSGCIGILLRHLILQHSSTSGELNGVPGASLSAGLDGKFSRRSMRLLGVDVSPKAMALAKKNARLVFPQAASDDVIYDTADVLALEGASNSRADSPSPGSKLSLSAVLAKHNQPTWDLVVANPPYISRETLYSRITSRSVRGFEPRQALTPVSSPYTKLNSGSELFRRELGDAKNNDLFYAAILQHACAVQAKVIWLEVGGSSQAMRVARMLLEEGSWNGGVEIWTDSNAAGGSTGAMRFGKAVLVRDQHGELRAAVVDDIGIEHGRIFSVFAQRNPEQSPW